MSQTESAFKQELPAVEMEDLYECITEERYTGKWMRTILTEPLEATEYQKHGTYIVSMEINGEEGPTVPGTRQVVHIESLPKPIMIALAAFRRILRNRARDNALATDLHNILRPLIEAGIAEELPEESTIPSNKVH